MSHGSVATAASRGFLSYVNQTGSPYHAVSVGKQAFYLSIYLGIVDALCRKQKSPY